MKQKSTKEIRKELAILIKQKLLICETPQQSNQAVNDARKEMNDKYGEGWREKDIQTI